MPPNFTDVVNNIRIIVCFVFIIEIKISNPLQDLVNEINQISNEVAEELLILLNKIAAKGPVPAMLQADTAIGRTLETLLGIDINSSNVKIYL